VTQINNNEIKRVLQEGSEIQSTWFTLWKGLGFGFKEGGFKFKYG